MSSECVAILQARMSSTRLPGKVLLPIMGRPMLLLQIERLKRCTRIDRLVVATSTDAADDVLHAACLGAGVECYRGSLADVLDRFYQAALRYQPLCVVRLTGDCPLADPAVVDAVVQAFADGGADYVSNTLQPTYPDGLDVEVFTFAALASAWREARLPSEREHVTPFIYGNPRLFRLRNVGLAENLSQMRWTVDGPEDLQFVRAVFEALYARNNAFDMKDILDLLQQHPELGEINAGHVRNEGFLLSLERDVGCAGHEGSH